MNIKLNVYNEDFTINIIVRRYNNQNIRLDLFAVNEGPFATITKNLIKLNGDFAYLDTNNCPWVEDLMTKYNLGAKTEITEQSGYCEYPLYKLHMNEIQKYIIS